MDDKIATKLREPFKAGEVGKLPRVTCPKCADRKVQCDEHVKVKCDTCKAYVSTRHIHIDYVGHADVTSRLLEADPDWNWEPKAEDEHGLPVFDTDDRGGPVGLWIKLTVGGVMRLGYGSVPSGQPDAVKVLIGDALRNAAMRFGVALDLWAKGDRADPAAENATASAGQAARRGSKQQSTDEEWRNSPPVNRPRGQAQDNGNGHVARPAQRPQQATQATAEGTGTEPDADAQGYADEAAEARTLDALRPVHKKAFDAEKLGATIRNPAGGNTGPLGPYLEWRRKQLTDDARAWKELENAAVNMSAADLNAHVKKVTGTEIEGATAAQLRAAAEALTAKASA